jgi:hypothetical protein
MSTKPAKRRAKTRRGKRRTKKAKAAVVPPRLGHNGGPPVNADAAPPPKRRQLLRGASAIALYLFGDRRHHRAVPSLARDLPLFELAGRWHAYSDEIDAAVAAAKQASAMPMQT